MTDDSHEYVAVSLQTEICLVLSLLVLIPDTKSTFLSKFEKNIFLPLKNIQHTHMSNLEWIWYLYLESCFMAVTGTTLFLKSLYCLVI